MPDTGRRSPRSIRSLLMRRLCHSALEEASLLARLIVLADQILAVQATREAMRWERLASLAFSRASISGYRR